MQWLADICVRRPVFASVLILSLTVVGGFAFFQLGVDRFPKVDFPTIVVTTVQPGATPEQVETEITDKVEEAVNTISGIDELRSVSFEGVSQVIVSFVLEKDVDIAAQEVRDKVNRVLSLLPRDVEQPIVEKFDPDASPVLTLAVTSNASIREVTEFADKTLRRQLENVNGVGQVLVLGGRRRQVNVWVDADRLRAYNLTVTDVQRALQTQNAEIPGGRLEQGRQAVALRTLGRVQSVGEFSQIVVRQQGGHPIRLGDVARLEDGMAEAESLSNVDGVGTVVLQIRRQSGTNTVQVVRNVKERLDDIRPTLPAGFDVRVVRDQSTFIEASIHAVQEHLVLGSIFAAIVVFIFLWNTRSTVIAAVAIPTSIIATFGLIWYMGFTLNSLTMLALTLAVGIVIDDAIVVLENIYRFIEEKGRPPFEAAIEATREIGLAVMATTFSLVAIFIPVAFMGGIVGRFMKSFGLTMSFAILVSLLVSFTLTPMMSARWLRREPKGAGHESKDSWFFRLLDNWYTGILTWALGHRAAVTGMAFLILLSSVPLFMLANKTFLPVDDQSEFEISMRAEEGTSLEATELLTNRIAARVREAAPEVDYTLVTVGADAARTPNVSSIYVRLKPLESRRRSQFAVMNQVRDEVLPAFASLNLRTAVQDVPTFGGGGTQNAALQYIVTGPDLERLQEIADRVVDGARGTPGLVDLDTSMNVGKPEVSVRPDRLKAADLGVQIADAANALRLLVGGDQVTTYNEGGEQYEVRIRAEAGNRTSKAAVGRLTVPSSRLGSVSLDDIATLDEATAPAEINRVNRQRQVTVYGNLLQGYSQTTAMDAMQRVVRDMGLEPGYRAQFTGRSRELGRAAQNFLLAFVLSLVFMYLILAAQFESWLHPVTILLSLPLTLPFAFLSIILTGQSINIYSSLGLLVLFGVVKKNSILQIDHAIQLQAAGLDRDRAVLQASRDRLRPILMTTLAFVAGMIPLVMSSGVGSATNRAIGFVIIGGQSLVLVLTLVVTPVAYSLFDQATKARLVSRLWGRLVPGRAASATVGAAVLALIVALSGEVHAGQAPAQARADLPLSLDDAVRRALEQNADLAVVRVEPELGRVRTEQAEGAFRPVLFGQMGWSSTVLPPSSFLLGDRGVETNEWYPSLGVRQRLRRGGGTYTASWDSARTTSGSPIASFSPAVTSSLQIAFSQPLLKDAKIDAARQQVIVTKRHREISDLRFREAVSQTVASVRRAYWDFVSASANVAVQERSLDLARELVRINRARVDVGQAPPIDLVQAEAEVAARREQLIRAQSTAADAEDRLRALIISPDDRGLWRVTLRATDPPPPVAAVPDVEAAVSAALASRADLERGRLEVQNAETQVAYFRNQQLPDVRLEASYRAAALGGTQLIREGGFPGQVVATRDVGFGSVLEQVFRRDYPAWTAGVTVTYPLGRSYEDAALTRAELERRQASARLGSLAVQAEREIRQAARQVASSAERVDATRAARDFAVQRLDAEQKRYEVGLSTSFLVVQAQRDLAQAEVNLLQSQLDHEVARINFELLQEAPVAAGTLGVSGGQIVNLPPGVARGLPRTAGGGIF